MQQEKSIIIINKIITAGLYLLTALMPIFLLPTTSNAIEVNKQFLLIILGISMVILWLVKIIIQSKLKIAKNPLNIVILLFLATYLIISIVSKDKYQSLVGFGASVSESFAVILALCAFYFVITNNIEKVKLVKRLVLIFIFSIFIAVLIGLFQLYNIYPFAFWSFTKNAVFNTVGSYNSLSILSGLGIILSIACFLNRNIASRLKAVLGAMAVIFIVFAAFLKFWNVLLALAVAMVLYLLFTIFRKEENLSRLLLAPMIILGLTIVFYITLIQPFSKKTETAVQSIFKNMPAEILPAPKLTFDIAKKTLKDNLWTGSGPATWVFDFNAYKPKEVNLIPDLWNIKFIKGWSYAFMLPATMGLIGTLAWLLIVLSFLIYALKRLLGLGEIQSSYGSLSLGLFIGWVYLLILQFLYPINMVLQFALWLIMALFIALSIIKNTKDKGLGYGYLILEYSPNSPLASIISFIFVIIAVLTAIFFYSAGQIYSADIYYQRGVDIINTKSNLQNGIDLLEKSVVLNSYSDIYHRSLAQAYWLFIQEKAGKVSDKNQNQINELQYLIDKMLSVAKKSIELSPKNVENWTQRAQIYQGLLGIVGGAEDWAVKSYESAIQLDPVNPLLYTELSRVHALTAAIAGASNKEVHFNEAENKINQALILKPDYDQAYILLALIYEQEGKINDAISRFEAAGNIINQNPNLLFQIGYLYMKQNKIDLAQAKFERAISLVDSYSNARYFLGLIYNQKNRDKEAIEQFEKILALNSDNQEVKQILKNLKNNMPALQGISNGTPSPNL